MHELIIGRTNWSFDNTLSAIICKYNNKNNSLIILSECVVEVKAHDCKHLKTTRNQMYAFVLNILSIREIKFIITKQQKGNKVIIY